VGGRLRRAVNTKWHCDRYGAVYRQALLA